MSEHAGSPTQVDLGAIPAKTDKGRAEVATRGAGLTVVQRRLLILVDGKKTVNDLGAFMRVGELAPAMDHLLASGFITSPMLVVVLPEPVGPGFASSGPAELARAATDPQEFEAIRRQTSDFVRTRLGAAGAPICAAIDRCDSPQELRKLLRGIELFVGERLDRATTQAFARHFGSLLL